MQDTRGCRVGRQGEAWAAAAFPSGPRAAQSNEPAEQEDGVDKIEEDSADEDSGEEDEEDAEITASEIFCLLWDNPQFKRAAKVCQRCKCKL